MIPMKLLFFKGSLHCFLRNNLERYLVHVKGYFRTEMALIMEVHFAPTTHTEVFRVHIKPSYMIRVVIVTHSDFSGFFLIHRLMSVYVYLP